MIKILAIDDNDDNLVALTATLSISMPEAVVITATKGKVGIQLAEQEQPDVILLDIVMPVMDGYEVCDKLKKLDSVKHIPIIMLTAAKTDAESKIKALDLGADSFLSKPIEESELMAQIKAMLRIKKSEDKLRDEKDYLDEIVKERTRDLEQELVKRIETENKLRSLLKDLENSNRASLNLMGDIQSEINERIKTEKALLKSEALLTETGRMAMVGGWELDAKTLEVSWTEETYRIHEIPLGTKPPLEEAINFFHLDDRPKLETAIQEALEFGKPYNLEIRLITAKGKHLWTHTTCKPIAVDGKIVKLSGTLQDITKRKQAEEAMNSTFEDLEKSRLQLRELNLHAQNIRENERADISREIHDVLGQALTALKFDLSWIRKYAEISNGEVLSKFDEMNKLIDETTSSVQRISTELRPGLLDDLGLTYALDWQCSEFERRTEIKTTLKLIPKEIILDEKISMGLFRILQESLTNVARHAKATKVEVALSKINNKVELKIIDNGIGINEENTNDPKSLGLLGITERAFSINGKVSFSGKKDIGTEVKVIVHLENEGEKK